MNHNKYPVIDNAPTAGNTITDELKKKADIHQGLGDERRSNSLTWAVRKWQTLDLAPSHY